MNLSKSRILAAVRREVEHRYKALPRELGQSALESLMTVLDKLPASWYSSLPDPPYDSDNLITETVRMALGKLRPDLIDKVTS